MRKGIIYILILSLFVFESCERESTKNTQNKVDEIGNIKQTQIKWLAQWYGEGKKENLIHEIARDFSFLNQDIKINYEFPYQMLKIDPKLSWFVGTRDSIISMINSNTWPYDIMLCDAYLYGQIADAVNDKKWGEKYLVDFQNDTWFVNAHKDKIFENGVATSIFGGIAPGAYIEGVWDLLYTSSVVEDKIGVKVKDYDMTIDDFIEYAKAVYLYNQKHDDKITFFSTQWYEGINMLLNHLAMSELGKDYKNVPSDPFIVLEKVYQKLAILAQYMPIEQYTTFKSDRDLQQDRVLLNFSYTWVTMFWKINNPEGERKVRPCELPSMTGKTARCYPGVYQSIFAIPKNAKNKDSAIKLMKFLSSSDIAYKWEKYSKCPTGLKSGASFNEFGSDDFNRMSQHMNQKYNNQLEQVNLAKVLFNTDKNVNFRISQILKGEISVEEALKDIKSQL
jgi:ABC-type glycerol-3-phosphate transport system substrate-binding protein